MHHKLKVTAVTAVAALGTFGLGVTGTAAADGFGPVYQVTGTGPNGLDVHRGGPQSSDFPVIDNISDGDNIAISCQATGPLEATTDANGNLVISNIWDLMLDKDQIRGNDGYVTGFVSDLYVNTPVVDAFSPGIDRCPPQIAGGGG